MAIRTTIVNATKNADGTYSEKEIHPFTDMNAVVSLKAESGNYDNYTALPLEGNPQSVLTALLRTRSYLYSLQSFKNKTVTDNYTETTNLTTKVPSMKAFVDGYTSCQEAALNAYNYANAANINANTRIPTINITNEYHVNKPSETKVISQKGSTNLYTTLNEAKIDKINIKDDYNPDAPNTNYVLSQLGASNLYADSLAKSIANMILIAPRNFLAPVYFNDVSSDCSNYVLRTNSYSSFNLAEIYQSNLKSDQYIEFFKITTYDVNNIVETINKITNFYNDTRGYNSNIFNSGHINRYTSASPHDGIFNPIDSIDPSLVYPTIHETCIIALVYKYQAFPFIVKLFHEPNTYANNHADPMITFSIINGVHDGEKYRTCRAKFNALPDGERIYTVERYINENLNTTYIMNTLDMLNHEG